MEDGLSGRLAAVYSDVVSVRTKPPLDLGPGDGDRLDERQPLLFCCIKPVPDMAPGDQQRVSRRYREGVPDSEDPGVAIEDSIRLRRAKRACIHSSCLGYPFQSMNLHEALKPDHAALHASPLSHRSPGEANRMADGAPMLIQWAAPPPPRGRDRSRGPEEGARSISCGPDQGMPLRPVGSDPETVNPNCSRMRQLMAQDLVLVACQREEPRAQLQAPVLLAPAGDRCPE